MCGCVGEECHLSVILARMLELCQRRLVASLRELYLSAHLVIPLLHFLQCGLELRTAS